MGKQINSVPEADTIYIIKIDGQSVEGLQLQQVEIGLHNRLF